MYKKKIILKKNADILETFDASNLSKYKKQAQEIKDLKIKWNDKMKWYQQKEALNAKEEASKLADLQFLLLQMK